MRSISFNKLRFWAFLLKKKQRASSRRARPLSSGSSDSSSECCSPTSSSSSFDWSLVDRKRGETLCFDKSLSAPASLRKKRALIKLAMEGVDHLPCKFVDWKKGAAKWLLTVESAAHAVELPFEYLINKLGKAIAAESAKMAEWIADHTAEGARAQA